MKKRLLAIKNKIDKTIVLTIIVLAIIGDITFFSGNSDFRIFAVLGLYGLSVLLYKTESKFTLFLCLTILSIMYIEFVLTGTSERTEKAAVWFILFLAVYIIHKWRETAVK